MLDHPAEFVTFKSSPHLPGVELYSARLIEHTFAPHVHEGYSLGAIEAGVERFRYMGTEHLAPAGTVVMLNPDEMHTGSAEVDAGWTYQMMYVEPDLLHRFADSEVHFPDAAIHDPVLSATFRASFQAMWNAPNDTCFISEFTRLVDTIVLRYGTNARPQHSAPVHRVRNMGAMRRVVDCIEAHLHEPLSVRTLAAEADLSLFHFVRAFAATFHATPHQYLQARRAALAKTMLAQRMPPSAAAAAVGLTDQSHLNKWFKRAYGVTPAQYQQQIGTRPAVSGHR